MLPAKGLKERRDHIFGIDTLRFLAAFLVLLFHFGTFARSAPQQYADRADLAFPALEGWTQYGWIGVQFFFVLSGYVIAKSAAQGDWKTFLKKRALRILPALWICVTVALVVRVAVSGEVWARLMDWARSVVLLPKGPYIDGVIWTLVVEMLFYLAVAAVVFFFKSNKDTEALLDRMALVLGSVSGAFICLRLVLETTGAPLAAVFTGFEWTVLLLNHGVLFATGMLLTPFNQVRFSRRRTFILLVFGTFCMLQVLTASGTVAQAGIANIIFGLMVLGLLAAVRYNSLIILLSGHIPFQTLGKMSYPLYLGHFAVGMHIIPALAVWTANPALLFMLSLGLILIYAWYVAAFAEPKLRNILRNII